MADEAVLVLKYEDPIDFIVADGATIPKGSTLKLSSPRTVALSDGASDVIAGIAARDKVANDGRTRLAVYRRGIFRMGAEGTVTAGQTVVTHGNNKVKTAAITDVGAKTLGTALSTSDAAVEIELAPGLCSPQVVGEVN